MLKLYETKENQSVKNATAREFHKAFFIILKIFQVLDEPIPKWTYFVKIIMIFCALIATGILSLAIYHGIEIFDLPFITEAGVYFLIMSYKLLILSCTRLNVINYYALHSIMEEDFKYIYGKGSKYRTKFLRNQILTKKIFKLAIVFTGAIGSGMLIFAVCSLAFHSITNNSGDRKRPLLFPFWIFEIDFGLTPTYEIAFMFSNICICAYVLNYVFMIGTQIMWIREIALKADIVIWSIEDLMEGITHTRDTQMEMYFANLLKLRMKDIIQQHYSMISLLEHYAQVYKKLLLFEQKISAPVVCLSAYAATEKWDAGEFNAILILLCVGAITLIFIPCYLCTFLCVKINSICYACWNIPFWNAGPVIRPYLLLIMQRSLQPLPIKSPGFEEVSLQTFSNKMASAYSFFNMLRQANI
ncbi:uncharacterized protein LOC116767000 [Danaus plexippus]|uniref:uncharacterized protein LOC116767000 n=1 Tax=Danaus plexippus TaxID=13037 RepID=UPI002AAF3F04|nr:uncharacterized protein LOC116767000 [Danaus plexippus]